MTDAILSQKFSKALVGIADRERMLPDEVTLGYDNVEDYQSLADATLPGGKLFEFGNEVKHLLLSHRRLIVAAPPYDNYGIRHATNMGLAQLRREGVIDLVVREHPSQSWDVLPSERQKLHLEVIHQLIPHSALFVRSLSDYLIDEEGYSEGYVRRIGVSNLEYMLKYYLIYSIFTSCYPQMNYLSKSELQIFDILETSNKFGNFLTEIENYNPRNAIERKILENLSFHPNLVKGVVEWGVRKNWRIPIKSLNVADFINAIAYAIRNDWEKYDLKNPIIVTEMELSTLSQTSSVAASQMETSRVSAFRAIRAIIGDGEHNQEIQSSIRDLVELKRRPIYRSLQDCISEIVENMTSGKDDEYTVRMIISAARELNKIQGTSEINAKISNVARIATYASVPIGLAEALTYGGPFVGLSVGFLGVGAQMTLDKAEQSRGWIAQLRNV